ncbi:MAG TPA: ATP-dependent helicase [Ktedonobacterales bacterium]|nr:ATP-dependent helicase [Ktedonobacterales bacterium]
MEDLQRPHLAAERLLTLLASDGQLLSAATPLDTLAERLGVDVLLFNPEAQRHGVLGWLEPGENVIYLRTGLPRPIRQFTLAHELGHYVLHRRNDTTASYSAELSGSDAPPDLSAREDCDDRDLDTPIDPLSATDETLRPGQAYSARARRESEANIFAATLLLPPARLLAAYRESGGAGIKAPRRLRALADYFGVSEDVLLRQLGALLTPATATESEHPRASNGGGRVATLDSWQRAAAESETPALVVAGPGTGKTSTLVARVAYLVAERGIPPHQILALTFSNKAAREMRERLDQLLGAARAGDEGRIALPTISTLHAFCGDLLRSYAPNAGLRPDFRLVSETDGYFLLRELASTLRLAHYQPLSAPAMHFPALLAAISRAKDELCEPDEYAAIAARMREDARTAEERGVAERAAEVAEIYHAYQATLEARGDADFGDMIRLAVRVLREHPDVLAEVRMRYQHVLVDEFQDINRAMGVLLQTLAGESGPLWAVGDADQAIYRFRGASPANLSRFASEYPTARIHTLRQNYRSHPAILDAAAALASARLDGGAQSHEPLHSVRGGDGTITLAIAPDEAAELAGLVEAIRAREASGRPLRAQVVLCRTRRQCQKVAAALQAAGVRTRLAVPMLEHVEIKDVLAVLSLLVELSGMGILRAGNLADHAFTAAEARALLAAARARHVSPVILMRSLPPDLPGISPAGYAGMAALRETLAELHAAPDVATGLARYVFELTSIGDHLLDAGAPGERRAVAGAMAQLLALARAYDDRRQAQNTQAGAGMRADWAGFLDYVRIVAALRQEAGANADELGGDTEDGVRVLTVHGSKGLEFPVVYLPGLVDRRFPIQRRGTSAPLPALVAHTPAPASEAEAHLTEEACLFYVAMTRARDELILSRAEMYGRMHYRPSPFLAPIEARLGDRPRRERWDAPALAQASTQQAAGPEEGAPAPDGTPVSISAIETYNRCPRQYAYRYLYRLRTREVGLATLRHALHETLDALHMRTESSVAGEAGTVSLEEAHKLFEERWLAVLERERGEVSGLGDGEQASVMAGVNEAYQTAPDPFLEVYRHHGKAIVERSWRQISEARAVELRTQYDAGVTVRVGDQEVTVTLDRVEHRDGPDGTNGRASRTARARGEEAPIRIVRHRIGRAEMEQADLRTLLYELAAQQSASPARPELQQQNLTTGETGSIRLEGRKLERLRERLDELLAGMRGGAYPPKPDPMVCPTCPFFLICPA